VSSFPIFGTKVTAPEEFSVKVTDPNPFDKIYVRWVSDFPPYSNLKSKLLATSATAQNAIIPPFQVQSACVEFRQGTPSPHQLVVIVADREFEDLSKTETLDNPYIATKEETFPPLMNSWSVTCQ
jgi:hypothetical protein